MSGGYQPDIRRLTTGELCGQWPDVGLWPIVLSLADERGSIEVIQRCIAGVSGLPESEVAACMCRFEARGWIKRMHPHLDWCWRITDAAPCRQRSLRPGKSEWEQIRARIFERDDYTCRYCADRGGELECDHVIPVSRGGSNDDDNLVTACRPCNRSKRDMTPGEWMQ